MRMRLAVAMGCAVAAFAGVVFGWIFYRTHTGVPPYPMISGVAVLLVGLVILDWLYKKYDNIFP